MSEKQAILEPLAETPKGKGLISKLCEVMAEAGYIQKRGHNDKFNYDYATEADVVDMLRDKLASRGIFVFPSVIENKRAAHSKTSTGADMFITDIMVRWTFIDAETGEAHECMMPGCGTDTGDKGIYKAITGSSKYMFLKGFMLPTGDDPEDEKMDKEDIDRKKKAARGVAADKLRQQADKHQDVAVALTEWKEGLVAVSGGGLAVLKAEVEPEALKQMGFKMDGNVVTLPSKNAFIFEDLCKRANVPVHWAQSAKKATGA